ncbi:MAG: deoxynucleoside kinase [Chloroflexi bacterium]|nr:deoxynucleoside kinase [Chloroflexota bacterium]
MNYYVAIEGVIGVGKTTLARYLQQALNASLLIEVFEENPFLARFYQDRARYAFQTQVFFLLSRYHQQRRLHQLPRPLVSDYIFAKDHLFAQLNLADDELATYESVYEALAENIPQPDLVVFLRADTSVLMSRIAARDRSYERNMDPHYIDGLRVAYDRFFTEYTAAPVLTIDTNHIDVVQDEGQRAEVIATIRGALGTGPRQAVLPGLVEETPVLADVVKSTSSGPTDLDVHMTARRLGDFQRFHRALDKAKNFNPDLFLNFVLLQEEIGEMARAVVKHWKTGQQEHEPLPSDQLRSEMADVLAYLLKIANYTGVDLEAAYLEKMAINQQRIWDSSALE